MLVQTPDLLEPEEQVLERIRLLWQQLKFRLQQEPHRWVGLLSRSTFARAVRGSNSIEGYEVSKDDAIAAASREEPFTSSANDDSWLAVKGYSEAMTYVMQLGSDPGFAYDPSLLRSLHFMMLSYDLAKHPGTWRSGSVYVRDESTGNIVYTAPDPELVPELVEELLAHLRLEVDNPLIRAAMAHLNLVLIHPFSDGNGRMARCLQTLVLARQGVFDPTFCSVEEYLGQSRQDYYNVLAEVGGGSWQPARDARPWIRFMLTAHYRQATTLLRRSKEMSALWKEIEDIVEAHGLPDRGIPSIVNAANGYRIRNLSYRKHADVTQSAATRDLKHFVAEGLLVSQGERRGRHYSCSPWLAEIRERLRDRTPIGNPFEDPAA